MLEVSQAQMKRLTAIHGWSAVVLGLLLYAVIATGAVAVFATEIGRWSAGGVRAAAPLEDPIDARIRRLAAEVEPEYRHDIGIWAGSGRDLHVFFHTHAVNPETGLMDDLGTIFRIDADSGEVLERHDGFIWHEPAAWETSALRNFLVDLHVQLYLPNPWGLILTGILGLMMMAAVVSGLLMHRHLIRDLFVAERPGARLVSARDRHVLAASWSIPFAFVLAFTGSFFSFAGTVGLPLVAAVAFGGDEEAMLETLYEPPVAEDPTPEPLASLDYILADFAHARRRAGQLRRHRALRPGRCARACLARPGGGRAPLRRQRLRRAEPGLPRPAGAARHRALGRRHALRADVSAALRPLRRDRSPRRSGARSESRCAS